MPIEHALFVGNSLPIREVDMLSTTRNTPLRVAANRGASGIDGQIATACGWAMGHRQPTTILLGDLSAIHDLNSLLLFRESPVPMTLIILNNDGGGIFSMLPISTRWLGASFKTALSSRRSTCSGSSQFPSASR